MAKNEKLMDDDCEVCFSRKGTHVRAERVVGDERMCSACINGEGFDVENTAPPSSLAVAGKGIKTSYDFASFMSCLMADLVSGKVPPDVGKAACTAGSHLLKVVEMQHKFGKSKDGKQTPLMLSEATKDSKGQ